MRWAPNWRSYRRTGCQNARIGRKSLRIGQNVLMSGLLNSSASGPASRDASVAVVCHCGTVNLPTLVIGPAGSAPVLAIGSVTKGFKFLEGAARRGRGGGMGKSVATLGRGGHALLAQFAAEPSPQQSSNAEKRSKAREMHVYASQPF